MKQDLKSHTRGAVFSMLSEGHQLRPDLGPSTFSEHFGHFSSKNDFDLQ